MKNARRGRPPKPAKGFKFEVTLARDSILLLKQLAKSGGLYGRSAPEVGGRFIEQALREFVDTPKFRLDELRAADDTDPASD